MPRRYPHLGIPTDVRRDGETYLEEFKVQTRTYSAEFGKSAGAVVNASIKQGTNQFRGSGLVEKRLGLPAASIGRTAFIKECLRTSQEAEAEYTAIITRLRLSVDWRWTYRTIDENARRISQYSFIELYRRGLAYRQEAPTIWCPECGTALAQADLNDLERQSEFVTIGFHHEDGTVVPIATTCPELLPACVAAFVHPGDSRYQHLLGSYLTVPLFGQRVPLLADPSADPHTGTGVVMCCTFGDSADVAWWKEHHLPYIEALFTVDQPFWGRRVHAIGAGPKPIPVKNLSTEKLAQAILKAGTGGARERAALIGRKIRSEDGVGVAVRLIEKYSNDFHR